jgi:hypothetical protein
MKTLFVASIFALCLGLSARAPADQDQRNSSVFCGGHLNTARTGEGIYDRSGRRVGELRQNPLFKNRTNVFDREGRQTGYLDQALVRDYLRTSGSRLLGVQLAKGFR